MIKNVLKIAFRNLWGDRFYALLNIVGLALGMAVTTIVFIWLVNELQYNTYNSNYDKLALINKNRTYNGQVFTETSNPVPLGKALLASYPNYFDQVVVSSYGGQRALKSGENSVLRRGYFMQPGGNEILDLKIIKGQVQFPMDASSILLSESTATSLFGTKDPIGEIVKIDNNLEVSVAGIYRDMPVNSTFRNVSFYGPFSVLEKMYKWVRNSENDWENNSFPIYVKLAPNANFEQVSELIQDELFNVTHDVAEPKLFLYPMNKWYLYPEFKNGKMVGTGIQNIWLFGIIGVFVLLLAAINFINLNTARSDKRGREIGVRKVMGSSRRQLIVQFLSESGMMVAVAAVFSLILVQLSLPYFNAIMDKDLHLSWSSVVFWGLWILFILLTSFLAGSYPAYFLSSFSPVKVLKGTFFQSGSAKSWPRKVLVIFQFSISIAIVIITVLVYQQIKMGQNRELGYNKRHLIQMIKRTSNLWGKYEVVRNSLMESGVVSNVAEATGPVTDMWHASTHVNWQGKASDAKNEFITLKVSADYGQTIGWKIIEGRDFSNTYGADSTSIILNEAAVKTMGFQQPIGQVIQYEGKEYIVTGVIQNLLIEAPFDHIKPAIYTYRRRSMPWVMIRLKEDIPVAEAVNQIKKSVGQFNDGGPLNLVFVDKEFNLKFWRESRMANLVSLFSVLAIVISCLGMFGLSTYMAQKRQKEIGVRKVLGASSLNIWQIMINEYMMLVLIACVPAFLVAYWFAEQWLQKYEFKVSLTYWYFIATGIGVLLITLVTVSFQSLKLAFTNPVKSIRTE